MREIRFASGFSGIGGFDLALQRVGFKRVWSCDNNKYANQIYIKHFGEENHHSGDIRRVNPRDIPSHDLFCAGFPCQAFSVAGKRQGFKDTRGTLFFEICRIAEHHRPSMLLLENVKGLLSHDGGRTFGTILESLEELGYWWEYQILNSKHFGVPQNRERVFIIGHLRDRGTQAIFPITKNDRLSQTKTENCGKVVNFAQTLRARDYENWNGNFVYAPKHAGALTGGGHSGGLHSDMTVIYNGPENANIKERIKRTSIFPTLDTQGSHWDLIESENIRRLIPVECERLQGFPDGWTIGISDTQRYKCLGNAVTVNVIEYLGELIQSSFSKSLRIEEK